ncbi:MAG: tetratricopeptide repeat protein [Proteobacteria bacterium]|nr:tetratricopeptide repeat protein [Pseudomonadota bacterium]
MGGGGGPSASSTPVVSVANVQPLGESKPAGSSVDFEALRKQAEADAGNAIGWTRLGNAYFDADMPALSIEAYKKSLAIDAGNADVWTDLGVMYRRNNEPERAVEIFNRALVANPGHETARFNKGIVLLHDLKDVAGAVATWEELVRLNPGATTPTGQPVRQLIEDVRKGG